jgi:integrase/recombinase XerD
LEKTKIGEEVTARIPNRLQGDTKKNTQKPLILQAFLAKSPALNRTAVIRVHGKGRRERAMPLWKTTATALRAWLAVRGTVLVPELFVNGRGEAMSRSGLAYLLKQHAQAASQQCPGLLSKRISPHVSRHTCAMIVRQATQDIRKVSLWLGHGNLATTEI